ncbi:MAG TPA: glycosyltransferase family 4 protein [Longimicrobiaceae bacterium]
MSVRARVLHVTTVPMSLRFLRGQVGYMRARGYEVHALTSPGEELDAFGAREGIPVHTVEMRREITPLHDLGALRRIVAAIRRVRPDVVHAHTPKGGLLGMLAAAAAGVPVRVYHMRGLPMMTAGGKRRALLRATERLSCSLAHQVICVSHSLREVAVAGGLCPPEKIRVLAGGSGNGVDSAGTYSPERWSAEERRGLRARWGIPEGATVLGFVGRIVRDKGVAELAEAWRSLREAHPELHLLMVGPAEPQDPLPAAVLDALRADPRVHLAGMQPSAAPFYAIMDLLALPTYREGFPNALLEAGAMELPVVATRIPGCVDAVVEGVTGRLVEARDAAALEEALRGYVADPALRAAHGRAARRHVVESFGQEVIWEALDGVYRELLARRAGRRPAPAAEAGEGARA